MSPHREKSNSASFDSGRSLAGGKNPARRGRQEKELSHARNYVFGNAQGDNPSEAEEPLQFHEDNHHL